MRPEDEAQLRYLMRKGKQLPMPISHLLKSVSKKRSKFVEKKPSVEQQAKEQAKKNKTK